MKAVSIESQNVKLKIADDTLDAQYKNPIFNARSNKVNDNVNNFETYIITIVIYSISVVKYISSAFRT